MLRQIEGSVLIECIVDADGQVTRPNVIRSLDSQYGLDAKAVEAARRWRFEPGMRDGIAVPMWITIEVTFKLKK